MSSSTEQRFRYFFLSAILAALPCSGSADLRAADQLEANLDSAIQDAPRPFVEALQAFSERSREKIVGGQPARKDQFPWQVSLMVSWIADPYYAHFCGGSLIDEAWILTAAHCVDRLQPRDVIIKAGVVSLAETGMRANVQRILVHQDYVSADQGDDIALLQLYQPLPLGGDASTIALMTLETEGRDLVKDATVTAIGWGAKTEGGQTSLQLNYVDVPYVERNRCNLPVSYDGAITETMICAGKSAGGEDACQGDSGGPLSLGAEQAGIVSWGEGCARANKFGIYTRVSAYADWIEACQRGTPDCLTK